MVPLLLAAGGEADHQLRDPVEARGDSAEHHLRPAFRAVRYPAPRPDAVAGQLGKGGPRRSARVRSIGARGRGGPLGLAAHASPPIRSRSLTIAQAQTAGMPPGSVSSTSPSLPAFT